MKRLLAALVRFLRGRCVYLREPTGPYGWDEYWSHVKHHTCPPSERHK